LPIEGVVLGRRNERPLVAGERNEGSEVSGSIGVIDQGAQEGSRNATVYKGYFGGNGERNSVAGQYQDFCFIRHGCPRKIWTVGCGPHGSSQFISSQMEQPR